MVQIQVLQSGQCQDMEDRVLWNIYPTYQNLDIVMDVLDIIMIRIC